jgi:hypothetical protein
VEVAIEEIMEIAEMTIEMIEEAIEGSMTTMERVACMR